MKKDVFDELVVVKRSGQRVNFNGYKIAVAIKSAFDNTNTHYDECNINNVYENVLKNIESNYVARKTINVEDIQDIIEAELKHQKYFKVYKEFNEYREKRAKSRQTFKIKQQHKFARAMERIIENHILETESSYKPNEIIKNYGEIVVDEYVKSYIIDNKYLRAFEEGSIYIDSIGNASLGKVSMANLNIESKLSICENITELYNYLKNASTEIDGEIHISNFDILLAKYFDDKFKTIFLKYLKRYIDFEGFDNYINYSMICEIVYKSKFNEIFDNVIEIALNDKTKKIFQIAYFDATNEIKTKLFNDLKYLFTSLNKLNNKYSFSIGNSDSNITCTINEIILNI